MKVKVKVFGGRLEAEVEADKETELFEGLAEVEELFGVGHSYIVEKCHCCKGKEYKFYKRTVEDTKKKGKFYRYFELRCKNPQCRARLPFGQMQEGGKLFPKKNEDGTYWAVYKKEDDGNE